MNTWIFYGSPEHGSSKKTIHFVKTCKKPERTKEYNTMRNLLKDDVYRIIGYCTTKKWNEDHNIIKFA
jgi:hypothetical protein